MLYVGRLSTEKYIFDVVRAFSVVVCGMPEARLEIFGNGEMETEVRNEVDTLGLNAKVKFRGFQSQERIKEVMLTADVTLIPLGGNVLVEASLARLPIVAYDVDWHSELIEHGKSALLAPFRDWQKMGEMALCLLQDRGLAYRLGMSARPMALEQRSLNTLYKIEASAWDRIF